MSKLVLELLIKAIAPEKPVMEHRFCKRRWRFDWAWPDRKIALEYDGYGKGHFSFTSYSNDRERDAEAQFLGWKVIRVTAIMVKDGRAAAGARRRTRRTTDVGAALEALPGDRPEQCHGADEPAAARHRTEAGMPDPGGAGSP